MVWYKEVVPNGKYYKEGLARLSEIEVGDGEASELKQLSSKSTGHVHQLKHDISGTPAAAVAGAGSETSGRAASGPTGTPVAASGASSETGTPGIGG